MIITIWTQRLAGSERVSNRGREVKGGLEQESGLADRKKGWNAGQNLKCLRIRMLANEEEIEVKPKSSPMRGELCFLFRIWGKTKGRGKKKKKINGEEITKRKQHSVSHSGGEAEGLTRILLAMSTIWNVESLPLSALCSYGVVLCLCAPSLCSDSTLKNRWRPRQSRRNLSDETHTAAHSSSMKVNFPE